MATHEWHVTLDPCSDMTVSRLFFYHKIKFFKDIEKCFVCTCMSQKNINSIAYKSDYSIYFFLLVSNSYV